MRTGRFDRRVTFIESVIEQGESNEDKILSWQEISNTPTVSARKIESSGNTLVVNDRVTFSQQTNWMIRFRTDLNVKMRLVYNMQVYEIINISENNEVRKRYMDISTQLLDNIYFT